MIKTNYEKLSVKNSFFSFNYSFINCFQLILGVIIFGSLSVGCCCTFVVIRTRPTFRRPPRGVNLFQKGLRYVHTSVSATIMTFKKMKLKRPLKKICQ